MTLNGNITEIPVKFYRITASDIVRHLQDKLGFPVQADFRVWDNRADWEKPGNVSKCYVIMRAIFRPEDVTVAQSSSSYMERLVNNLGSGIQFQSDVMDVLNPLMFPQNMSKVQFMPDQLQRLATMGIYGHRLEELMRRPNMFYDQINGRYGVYLRPERIITNMFIDVDANRPAGKVDIIQVQDAAQAEAIQWGCLLWTGSGSVAMSDYGVTIDDVFGQEVPK